MTMRKIDVDFDVHQLIELERRNFGESPNDVLRRLLGLRSPNEPTARAPMTISPRHRQHRPDPQSYAGRASVSCCSTARPSNTAAARKP